MTGHVLLVEDDGSTRELLALNLARAGYQVTQAASGAEAIALLTRMPPPEPPFAVVLADIVLGEIDGIEVMSVARRIALPPEVILITGYGSLETAIAAVEEGAFSYLLKPSQMSVVFERLAAAMLQFGQRQQQASESASLHRIVELVHTIQPHNKAADEEAVTAPPAAPTAPPDTEDNRFLTVGLLRIDTYRHEVWFEEQLLHLTPIEYAVLSCLAETPGRVVTYSNLAYHTYGSQMQEREAHDLLRFHIRNLRRKFNRNYLVSVRGVGCMLDVPEEPANSSAADE